MKDENIKLLIKNEYENGTSMSVLAKKYKTKLNTIKTWSAKEKWVKKKRNTTTKKGTTENSKKQPKKTVVIDKETQIKSDIINDISKEEILEKHGIKKSTYYNKVKSIRQLRKERTEKYLEQIADEVYKGELYRILKGTETAKANLVVRTTKEINSQEMDTKKVQEYEKAYTTIKKMGNDLMRTGKMLTAYEVLEIDRQLAEEEMQQRKLDIEANKNQVIEEKEQVVIVDDTDKD